MTLTVLKDSNQQLWFTICLRLGKIHLDLKNLKDLEDLLVDLKTSCKKSDGAYDTAKSNLLLEVFALEIQLCD